MEVPLSTKSERVQLFIIIGLFSAPLLYVPFLPWPGNVWYLLGMGSVSAGMLWFFSLGAKAFGCVALFSKDHLVLQRNGEEVFRLQWQDITSVVIPSRSAAARYLVFYDKTGQTYELQTMLPLVEERVRSLVSSHLPEGVVIQREIRGMGRRKLYAWGAALGLIGGVAAVLLSLQAVALKESPTALDRVILAVSPGLIIFSLIAFGVGLFALLGFAAWKPEREVTRLVPLARDRLSLLTALDTEVSEPLTFEYPEHIRKLEERHLRREWALTVGGLALFTAFPAAWAIWELIRGTNAFGPALLTVICSIALLPICWIMFRWKGGMRRLLPEVRSQIVLQPGGWMSIKTSQKEFKATMSEPPKATRHLRDTRGINGYAMKLEAGGNEYWFDPAMMFQAQERPTSPG